MLRMLLTKKYRNFDEGKLNKVCLYENMVLWFFYNFDIAWL